MYVCMVPTFYNDGISTNSFRNHDGCIIYYAFFIISQLTFNVYHL